MNEKNIALHITPSAERAVRQGHPWLYADAIVRQSHEGVAGDLAILFDQDRRFLAVGLYDPYSPIRVRILHTGRPTPIDTSWFHAKLIAAYALRQPLHADPTTTGYRLVHGENDGLPGLVLDRYDSVGVFKLDTPAWIPHLRPHLLPALPERIPFTQWVVRFSRSIPPAGQVGLRDGQTFEGRPITRPVRFLENGLRFAADVVQAQKTGFFFDHRDNRARVEQLAAGLDILNVFSYTGAFSLYAARGGARRVLDLDVSQPALAAAAENFKLNAHLPPVAAAEHELMVGDAFAGLRQLQSAGRRFDMVIVDPPSLARRTAEVEGALAAYRRLVSDALAVLRPDGILVMASCTGRVTEDMFYDTVEKSVMSTGRSMHVLARTGHALDHPIGFKEGAYLKCLFARVP